MKIFIALISLLSCPEKLKDVLDDISRYSPYISLKIQYQDTIAVIVIQNGDMFSIAESLKIEESQYSRTLCRYIKQKRAIMVDEKTWEKLKHKIAEPHSTVDSLKARGRKQLVEYYFGKSRILRKALDIKERNYLLKVLFDYGLYLKPDDETGYLHII